MLTVKGVDHDETVRFTLQNGRRENSGERERDEKYRR
jgi:hypothetical protein